MKTIKTNAQMAKTKNHASAKRMAFASAFVCAQALSLSQPVFAQDNTQSEDNTGTYWGIGIGTTLGAIIGGPIGAAAGAALGGTVGYGQDKDAALGQTEQQLDEQVMAVSALEGELKKSNVQLESLRAQTRQLQRQKALQAAELADLKAQDVTEREQSEILAGIAKHYSHEVYYRHNASSIPDYAKDRIDELASFMLEHKSIAISLQGHSDLIGAEDANLALTQARVDAIRDYLIDKGVAAERITSQAYGEAYATVTAGDASNYVLDRRVAIELSIPQGDTGDATAIQPLAVNAGGR